MLGRKTKDHGERKERRMRKGEPNKVDRTEKRRVMRKKNIVKDNKKENIKKMRRNGKMTTQDCKM